MGPEQTSDRAHMGEASLVWYQRLRHGQGMLRKPTSHVVMTMKHINPAWQDADWSSWGESMASRSGARQG